MLKLFSLLALCVFFLPNHCHAQVLKLYDAVNKAIAWYPLLQQRQSEIAAGRAHITTVNNNRLPSLIMQDQLNAATNNGLQGSYLTSGMVPSTPGTNNSALQNNNPNPNNVALTFLQWEFYNFGYYNAQKKLAKAQVAVGEASLGSDRYLLTMNIVSLYLDWLKKYRLLQIQDENMQRAQVMVTAIRANVQSGLKPGVDSSTASAAFSDARISYLQALDAYNIDQIALASFTGLSMKNIVPDTTIINRALLQGTNFQTDSVPLSHPLLNVYQKQYEQQLIDNDAIAKKYLPKLSMNGVAWQRNSGISYTGSYPESISDGLPYSKYNYMFGMTFTYNLFDLKHRHDQLIEGRFQALAKTSALQNEALMLNRMVQQANSSYATTLLKLKELPMQLNSAQQAYLQQMALYRSGLNTLIEVTNAQYTLMQAETNDVLTRDELLQLQYIQAGLAGQSDIFLQNFK